MPFLAWRGPGRGPLTHLRGVGERRKTPGAITAQIRKGREAGKRPFEREKPSVQRLAKGFGAGQGGIVSLNCESHNGRISTIFYRGNGRNDSSGDRARGLAGANGGSKGPGRGTGIGPGREPRD